MIRGSIRAAFPPWLVGWRLEMKATLIEPGRQILADTPQALCHQRPFFRVGCVMGRETYLQSGDKAAQRAQRLPAIVQDAPPLGPKPILIGNTLLGHCKTTRIPTPGKVWMLSCPSFRRSLLTRFR